MPRPLHSAIEYPITGIKDWTPIQSTAYPHITGLSGMPDLFPGEIITSNYDGKGWAQQEYEHDHSGWRSLGRIDEQ